MFEVNLLAHLYTGHFIMSTVAAAEASFSITAPNYLSNGPFFPFSCSFYYAFLRCWASLVATSLSLLSISFFRRFLGLNSVFDSRLSFSVGVADSRKGLKLRTLSHCFVGKVTETGCFSLLLEALAPDCGGACPFWMLSKTFQVFHSNHRGQRRRHRKV